MFNVFTRHITRYLQNSLWTDIAFVGAILSITAIGFIVSQHDTADLMNTILQNH